MQRIYIPIQIQYCKSVHRKHCMNFMCNYFISTHVFVYQLQIVSSIIFSVSVKNCKFWSYIPELLHDFIFKFKTQVLNLSSDMSFNNSCGMHKDLPILQYQPWYFVDHILTLHIYD